MWDDVVIGQGDKGCSAIKLWEGQAGHSISQNSVSYWVSNCCLGTGITIFKNTEEGKQLKEMLARQECSDQIADFLDGLVIRNIEVNRFRKKIEWAENDMFQKGKRAKALEIREALAY